MESILIYFVSFAANIHHNHPTQINNPNLSKIRSQVESISKFRRVFFCSTSFNRRTFSIIRDGTRSKFNSKRNKGDATGASRSVTQRGD